SAVARIAPRRRSHLPQHHGCVPRLLNDRPHQCPLERPIPWPHCRLPHCPSLAPPDERHDLAHLPHALPPPHRRRRQQPWQPDRFHHDVAARRMRQRSTMRQSRRATCFAPVPPWPALLWPALLSPVPLWLVPPWLVLPWLVLLWLVPRGSVLVGQLQRGLALVEPVQPWPIRPPVLCAGPLPVPAAPVAPAPRGVSTPVARSLAVRFARHRPRPDAHRHLPPGSGRPAPPSRRPQRRTPPCCPVSTAPPAFQNRQPTIPSWPTVHQPIANARPTAARYSNPRRAETGANSLQAQRPPAVPAYP